MDVIDVVGVLESAKILLPERPPVKAWKMPDERADGRPDEDGKRGLLFTSGRRPVFKSLRRGSDRASLTIFRPFALPARFFLP